jgi:ABC-2 type transport system ATP-binding protein
MPITVINITKSFEKKPVLDHISLTIDNGQIVCLLGPSGAGKTTLIRLLMGAVKADSGSVTIDDIRVPSTALYDKIGYMPQNDALYNDLTGFENLLFFGGLYHIKNLRARARELLTLLNLADDADKLVSNYSGGMKKRLSLAAALLHEPQYLFLDEPTVGIDPVLRQAIWKQFYRLRDTGTSLVISTHVMDEAVKCDRAALIRNGTLICCDTTAALLAKTKTGNIEDLFLMESEDGI